MVARGRLTDLAYQHVRERIVRGELPIGTPLGETELAEAVGSSRTPVRQALGRLLQEGLVELGARRQVVVRGFTPEHRPRFSGCARRSRASPSSVPAR